MPIRGSDMLPKRARQRVTRQVVFQRIVALADRYEIQFKNVLRTTVKLAQRVSLEKLAAAIATKNEAAIMAAIPWDDRALAALSASLPTLTRDLATASARLGERLLPGDLSMRFDIRNPLATQNALEHGAKLVTEIDKSVREAIRAEIANAIQEGRPPLQAARDLRGIIGLRSDQVATIDKLRDEGASAREIQRAEKKALDERTLLISRTETLWAANEGQRALWEQGVDSGLIAPTAQREFITTPDERLCPVCEPLDGNLYGIDESITTEFGTVDAPPIHPNCRCTMSLVT